MLKEALSDLDVVVIFFARRQDEMAVSHYAEFVKRGHTTQDFPEFAQSWRVQRLKYNNFAETLSEIFGNGAVIAASYNRSKENVFGEFCKLAGIEAVLQEEDVVVQTESNVSLDRDLLKCLFFLRINAKPREVVVGPFEEEFLIPFANFFNERFPQRPREPFRGFSERLADEYMTAFHAENAKFARSWLDVEDAFPRPRSYPPLAESLMASPSESYEIHRLMLQFLARAKGEAAVLRSLQIQP